MTKRDDSGAIARWKMREGVTHRRLLLAAALGRELAQEPHTLPHNRRLEPIRLSSLPQDWPQFRQLRETIEGLLGAGVGTGWSERCFARFTDYGVGTAWQGPRRASTSRELRELTKWAPASHWASSVLYFSTRKSRRCNASNASCSISATFAVAASVDGAGPPCRLLQKHRHAMATKRSQLSLEYSVWKTVMS